MNEKYKCKYCNFTYDYKDMCSDDCCSECWDFDKDQPKKLKTQSNPFTNGEKK